MSDDSNPAEAAVLLEAGSKVIARQEGEIKELRAAIDALMTLAESRKAIIEEKLAELERVTRARDVACFNIADLTNQRAKLMEILGSGLQLIEYLLGEMRAGGVVPSVACQLAHKTWDDKMHRLFKSESKVP
jgi:uncharacterized protein YydD (DUF2326 family)